MSTANLGSLAWWSGLVAWVFALLVFSTSFALAQDPYDEIPKLQERYESLAMEVATSQKRILSSSRTYASQENAYTLLNDVWGRLTMMDREFSALNNYKLLASLVTEKWRVPHAMRIVDRQRDYMKKLNTLSIETLEKTMHAAGDQETTRLALAARDLYRSSAELLDRLQVTESTPK